jgi:predicted dehydrogenase
VRLTGIVARPGSRSADILAQQHGVESINCEDLLADVDIVDICVPTDCTAMAVQAAPSPVSMSSTKAIALSVADGRAMISVCAAAGVRLFVGLVLRFVPEYAAAQQVVASGQIGAPGVMRLTRCSYQPHKAVDNWFADESRSGGMVLDLMIHDFDYARWLAGNVTRVFAKSARAIRPDSAGDYALVTLRFASGAIAHIEGGWAYPAGMFRTSLDIAGTDGVLEWNSDSTQTTREYLMNPPQQEAAEVGYPEMMAAESPFLTEIRHFYNALVNNQPFGVTAEDALAALQIALAARESLKTGRSVTINQEAL